MPSLIWPLSSSDLNPIESFWNLLKNKLNQRSPRPKGVEMKRAIMEEWDRISEEVAARTHRSSYLCGKGTLAVSGNFSDFFHFLDS